MMKLRLDDNRVHISVFWLVLAGVAVYTACITIIEWTEAMKQSKWIQSDCLIVDSHVESEAGEDWEDLFVVRYQYAWDGELIEADVYQLGYVAEPLFQ